jgi:hypothetical protein
VGYPIGSWGKAGRRMTLKLMKSQRTLFTLALGRESPGLASDTLGQKLLSNNKVQMERSGRAIICSILYEKEWREILLKILISHTEIECAEEGF